MRTAIPIEEVRLVMVRLDKIVIDRFLNEMGHNDLSVEEAKVVHLLELDDRLALLVDVLVGLELALSRVERGSN